MLPLVCECAHTGCSAPIEVESAVFEPVREKPLRYLVVPGHEKLDVESVVSQHLRYLVVEKLVS